MRSHYRGHLSEQISEFTSNRMKQLGGLAMMISAGALTLALASWSAQDPSLNHATNTPPRNLLGAPGAITADIIMQLVGFGAIAAIIPLTMQGMRLMRLQRLDKSAWRLGLWCLGIIASSEIGRAHV